jgi:hypothetical protein
MSVIYRPRHHPYIPNGPTPALIQNAVEVNDLPAIFNHARFGLVIRRRSRPFIPLISAALLAEEDSLSLFANRWKLFAPQRRTRPSMDFPYPGGEDVVPPIVVGTKTLRHTQGRGPQMKLMKMRNGRTVGPSTR